MLLTTRHDHPVIEMLKWAILVMLALTISLAVVSRATGHGPETPPLPANLDEFARPLTLAEVATAEPSVVEAQGNGFDAVLRLARILDLHAANESAGALAEWRILSLPRGTTVWRHVAMAAAHLQLGSVDQSLERLQKARAIEPNNPVVHYFLGLAYREKAADARDWFDAGETPKVGFAALLEAVESPNSKSVFELRAMNAFERAIELATELRADRPLLAPAWSMSDAYELAMPMVVPTVGDLLRAVGADNFATKSHHILGRLY